MRVNPSFFKFCWYSNLLHGGRGTPFTDGFREKGFDTFPWLDKDRNTNCNEREAIQYNDWSGFMNEVEILQMRFYESVERWLSYLCVVGVGKGLTYEVEELSPVFSFQAHFHLQFPLQAFPTHLELMGRVTACIAAAVLLQIYLTFY